MESIKGIHHITAIAGEARRNLAFYTSVLGQRLVKKTVNFDDPGTYHFYFGDEVGTPGTILTFFPWEGISQGRIGAGMAESFAYAVPAGSLARWKQRLADFKVSLLNEGEFMGEKFLTLLDPDGLHVSLVERQDASRQVSWTTPEIDADMALRSFYSITLNVNRADATSDVLTGLLGYRFVKQEGNVLRFVTDAWKTASTVDVVEEPGGVRARNGGGTIHHVAFRVENEDVLMAYREKALERGLNITPKIDRNYFFSLYFREPGGVLFEIATDNPGFTVDEPVDTLGTSLKLPAQYEASRAKIEAVLPSLK